MLQSGQDGKLSRLRLRGRAAHRMSSWLRGLVTYYVLFFIHLESRRVDIVGTTVHPNEAHLRRIVRAYASYCNKIRTHRSLDKDAPASRPFKMIGTITS